MKRLLLLLPLAALSAEMPTLYTVTVGGEPPLWKMTNCLSADWHTNNCCLIKWVEHGQTNEFHAWAVPVKIEKQPKPMAPLLREKP